MAEKEKTPKRQSRILSNPATPTGSSNPPVGPLPLPPQRNEEGPGPSRIHSMVIRSSERKDSGSGLRRFASAGDACSSSVKSPGGQGRGPGSPVGSRNPSTTQLAGSVAAGAAGGGGGGAIVGSATAVGFNRRHRMSGLFSRDDLSIDMSTTASDIFRPALIDQVPGGKPGQGSEGVGGIGAGGSGGGDKEKHHPLSIAGSSIGSSSLGSASADYNDPLRKRNRYRYFRRRWRRFRRKFKGCIFAIISSLTSSLASYFVHELTNNANGGVKYSPAYCLFWRQFFGVLLPGIFIVLYYRLWCKDMVFDLVWPLKDPECAKRFGLSVARGVMDVMSIYMAYAAFGYLMLSEASTILNSKPIFVQLLAHFTLGEEWGIVPIIMSIITAVGVMVMSKPPFIVHDDHPTKIHSGKDFVHQRLPGIGYSLASMLISAVTFCILRYLKDVHYSVFSLFIGTAGAVLGAALTFSLNEFVMPKETRDIIYLITIAGLVCCSSICIVIALQNEEAFVVSLIRTLDAAFSFLWEMCIDQTYPDWYNGGGAMIIMFCVGVIFFRKYLYHQDPESKVYKTFIFLTK